MPIVNIDLAWLNRLLGKDYPTETLRESLEQIGCDVEDVVDIDRSRCPQCGSLVEHPLGQDEVKVCGLCGFESESPFKPAGSKQVIRLDLLAARPALIRIFTIPSSLRTRARPRCKGTWYDIRHPPIFSARTSSFTKFPMAAKRRR